MSGVNEYDALLAADTKRDQTLALKTAQTIEPAQAAEARTLAQRAGLPTPVVERNLDTVRQQVQQNEYDQILASNPTLGESFRDPEFAKLARNDVRNLSALEQMIEGLKNTGRALKSSFYNASGGLYGVARAGVEVLPFGVDSAPAQWLAEQQGAMSGYAKELMPKAEGTLGAGYYAGIQSLGQSLLTLPLAFAPGGQGAYLGTTSAMVGGQSYGEARDKGTNVPTALGFSVSQAAVEFATEKIPLAKLLGDVKAGTPFFETLLKNAALEIPGEQVATVVQDLNEWAVLNPEKPFSEYLKERPSAAAQTLIATLVGTGGQVSVVKGIETVVQRFSGEQARADRAQGAKRKLDEVAKVAQLSETRQNAPDKFAELVDKMLGPDADSVHLSADDARTFFQSKPEALQVVQERLPEVAASVQEAMVTGGDVVIPAKDYVTYLTEYHQDLAPQIRLGPEAMSAAEAEAFTKEGEQRLQQEADRIAEQHAGDTAWQQSADEVQAFVREQIVATGRFTPDVADKYAALHRAFAVAMGERLGVAPAEVYQRYGLRVQGAPVEGLANAAQEFNQDGQRQTDTPAFRNWFGDSKVVGAEGKPLVVYHGTTRDFGTFDPAAKQVSGDVGPLGVFFTEDPGYASAYAADIRGVVQEGGRVVPAYLALKNPKIESTDKIEEIETTWDKARVSAYKASLIRQGHDGIVFQGAISEYVAFRPEQIKSVNNRGTFDPNDPNILHQAPIPPEQESEPQLRLFQSAYHGTPHSFDEFSLKAVGTGEGQQAYGWGLYFAGNRAVAEFYRGILSAEPIFVDGAHISTLPKDQQRIARAIANGRDPAAEIDDLRGRIAKNEGRLAKLSATDSRRTDLEKQNAAMERDIAGFEALQNKTVETRPQGNLYQVDIPDDNDLLDWDKPLSEQPAGVREAINDLLRNRRYAIYDEPQERIATFTGEAIYRDLADHVGSPEGASQLLNRFGIPGLRYLDGSSRDQGDGSHNYVIWDENRVTVEAVNDELRQAREFAQGGTDKRGAIQFPADLSTAPSVISLLEKADLSTFLHESGHFFLQVYADVAQRQDAPAAVQQDAAALLQWFGVDSWTAVGKDQHEQFARGFEAYLFEGKAPNVELQGVFQRFRAWLVNVYKSLSGLNVELTDEVRQVMGRMLATDAQIQAAQDATGFAPLFTTAAEAGMTEAEFAEYKALGEQVTQDATDQLQTRSLRDMRWLANAKARVLKELQAEAKVKRQEVRVEVAREVWAQPIYRVMHFLKRGELPNGEALPGGLQPVKFATGALREMYGDGPDAPWRKLAGGKYGMTAAEGAHPDTLAELFGFSSGDELVRALLDAEDPASVIEGRTDQRVLERYGDIADPAAMERAAEAAIHNEARSRFVATELRALDRKLRVTAKTAAGGSYNVEAKAAKAYADLKTAQKPVREAVKSAQYVAAEARAAKAADAALRKGDAEGAARAKRAQLLNGYFVKATTEAAREVERTVAYLKKFDNAGTRKALPADFLDQIDALLERYDLRKSVTQKQLRERKTLAEWAESQRAAGMEPDIDPRLLQQAQTRHYSEAPLEELRGLRDAVKQIEHLGRVNQKILTAHDQAIYTAVRDEIATSIETNAGNRTAETRTPTTNLGRTAQGLRRFWAAHIKAATWARVMDGGKDGGPMWEYFIRSANERGDQETTLRAEATRRLTEIMAPVFKQGRMGGKGEFFPTIGRSLNREARIALALNTGNEGNLQRLLGGEGWTRAQIQPVLESLTAEEWGAVQAVWDHFESYKPQIAAKERRVYGKEPAWVEPVPFTVATRDGQQASLRGGYYPIKYDPAASQRAEEHADAEQAKRDMQGAYTSATTRRSFTKARVEEVQGRPLLYSLAGLYSGVNDVIHDLSWHEWLIDANRLLRSQTIDNAIRQHYGPEVKEQFKLWVKAVAEGDRGAADAGERALARLRQGVSAAGLGFNVMSALIQPLGITQSIVRVGAPWVGRGVVQYLAGPMRATRGVNAKSDFMANRARTRFRELNELRNKVEDETRPEENLKAGTYFLMMRFQQMVDVPTWLGAYEKAIAEGHNEARAVALADQAVIDSQGGGQTKDLAGIERGGPALKLFTVYYSFMNTAFNLGAAQTMTAKSRAKLAADYLLLYSVPAVLGLALRDALTPGDSGDWEDPEKTLRRLLAAQLDYLMGLMVVVREFSEAAKVVTGADDKGRDYAGPAGLRLVADAGKLAAQVHQGEFDTAFRKAAVNLVGDAFGLPAAQVNRTVTGAEALAEGDTENPFALVTGYQTRH